MVKKRPALPRLINIAIGLTVASLIAAFGASFLPEPHHTYGLVSAYEFATGLAAYLFLAAILAWALVILAAIIRWNSDFPGY